MTTYRLLDGASGRPGVGSSGTRPPSSSTSYGGALAQGMLIQVSQGGLWLDGYWYWRADSSQSASAAFALWQATGSAAGTVVAGSSASTSSMTAGQFNYAALAVPLLLSPGIAYKAVVGAGGNFSQSLNQFDSGQPYAGGITNGPLSAYSSTTGTAPDVFTDVQGSFTTATSSATAQYPSTDNSSYIPWLDVQADTAAPAGAGWSIWANMPSPLGAVLNSQTTGYALGTQASLTEPCVLNQVRFYSPAGAAALPARCGVFNLASGSIVAGTENDSPSWSGAAGSGWVTCSYASPPELPAGVALAPAAYYGGGQKWFAAAPVAYWTSGPGASGFTIGPISVPGHAAAASPGQGPYATSWTPLNTDGAGEVYWTDWLVTPVSGAGLMLAAGLP